MTRQAGRQAGRQGSALMPQGQVRSELERFRDRLVEQRDALTDAIDAIDVAIQLFGEAEDVRPAPAPPLSERLRDAATKMREGDTPPPRPQPPAPPATKADGQTNDDKVLHALRNGPLNPKSISQLTGISKWTLQDVLARMTTVTKILTKSGNRRSLLYRVKTT